MAEHISYSKRRRLAEAYNALKDDGQAADKATEAWAWRPAPHRHYGAALAMILIDITRRIEAGYASMMGAAIRAADGDFADIEIFARQQ